MTPHVLLVDAKNLLYRAAAATGMLARRDDREGSHVYVFAKSIMRAVDAVGPTSTILVWEGDKNWRKREFAGYKAHRDDPADVEGTEAREELRRDVVRIQDMLRALDALQAHPRDGEADDALATLAVRYGTQGKRVTIWSGDHDMLQCVYEPGLTRHGKHFAAGVRVVVPGKSAKGEDDAAYETDEHVVAKMGVPPHKVADFKAIAGDASDGIPGIKGLGPVAARKLLEHCGHLTGVIMCAELSKRHRVQWHGTEKQRDLVLQQATEAVLWRKLATVDEHASIVFDRPAPDGERAKRVMREMGAEGLSWQGTFAQLRRALRGRM